MTSGARGAISIVMDQERPLRRGWTTGACATAATAAAYSALLTGSFPDPVEIRLPGGKETAFALAFQALEKEAASAGIVKDAGDDPDVTHGVLVKARVMRGAKGSGLAFKAGEGVGTVTLLGLPIPPGEPAINPVPRRMIAEAVARLAEDHGEPGDVVVEISIPGGEAIARKTLNPRLGILGGLSILGTTGIVVPYSCAAWIHSIHRGIDVARALGIDHVAGATGSVSEAAVARLFGLSEQALIDMGDFVGGMLKYLRLHPLPRVTIAGGFAKMSKLGQGLLDLHSRRGEVDLAWLAGLVEAAGGDRALIGEVAGANTALAALNLCRARDVPIGNRVALAAKATAQAVVEGAGIEIGIAVFDRDGHLIGSA